MNRVITVKGIGNVSAKPDLVEINLTLSRQNIDYERTMKESSDAIGNLQETIVKLGFDKKDLKTTDFSVRTEYERKNYKSFFKGFLCSHRLKFEFDFEMSKLSEVLSAFAHCESKPEFTVNFTVKNKTAVNEALLVNATENAKAKAQILAKASGVTLGQIVNIDYNWGEMHMYSDTKYCLMESDMMAPTGAPMDFEPDDIDVSDTVTFVWEII